MSAEESSWSEGRGSNEQDEKERELARQRALEAFSGVNALLRKFADDEDLHEDLKQPEVKVAVKHWTGEKRLDTETAAKLFSRENYRVMSVLQKIRILQAECQKAGLPVPLDHVLRRESELRLNGAAAGERTEQKPSAASKATDKKKKSDKTDKGRAAVKPTPTSAEAASTPSTGEAPGQSSVRTGVKGAAAGKGLDGVKEAEEGVDLAAGRSRGVLSLLSTLIVPLLSTVVAFLLTIWLFPKSQSKSGGQEGQG